MTRQILLTLLLLLTIQVVLPAQITLGAADAPAMGDSFTIVRDTAATGVTISAGSATAQTWDFSNLVNVTENVRTYIAPASTPTGAMFPTANLALDVGGFYSYLEISPTALSNIGIAGDPFGVGLDIAAPFTPAQKIYELPATYGTMFTSDFGFGLTIDGSFFMVDSIRIRRRGTVTSEIDAYGMITTPTGTYEAIREHKIETTVDSVWAQIFGFETFFQEQIATIETYDWIAKETKGPIVSVTIEEGEPVSATYTIAPSTAGPLADFNSEDQTGGEIDFRDQSNNLPDTWAWDFGDGNTSTMQHPTHTYAADGTYNVCLTVTNSFGSDMICEMITVSTAVAPEAAFIFVNNMGSQFEFTDMSANMPTTWAWDFGDGSSSTLQNPTYSYITDGMYTVCLTATNAVGSDTTCEDVEVNLSPSANFSYTNINEGQFEFVDMSTNIPTSWAWSFGDGNGSSLQNPQYIYASSGVYEVCLTATNSGGSDMTCQNVTVQLTNTQNILFDIDIKLYPNPAKESITFEIENLPISNVALIFTDVLGQRLCNYTLNNNSQQIIDVKNWSKGIYFYHLCTAEGTIIQRGNLVVN